MGLDPGVDGDNHMGDGWGGMLGWGWGGGAFGWVVMALLVVAAVAIVALAARGLRGPTPSSGGLDAQRPSAVDILEERLARGEISVEEFRTLGAELRAGPDSSGPPSKTSK